MKKVVRILLTATLVFCIGGAVAYYNTSSFGYGSATLFRAEKDGIQVLDFSISYQQMKEAYEQIAQFLPDKKITI